MFCTEPIIHIYERRYFGEKERSWHGANLRLSGRFEYHATEGYWLVFQTKHFVISMGHDGVQLYIDMDDFCDEDELDPLSDAEDWKFTEETLFVGERIQSASHEEDHWVVTFDHFSLNLYGYTENTARRIALFHNSTCSYIPLAVENHLLKRKCRCGGEGEIFLNFVSDYLIRCKTCHASTWAGVCLIDAVADWNEGDTPIRLDTDEEQFFEKVVDSPIRYIALEDRSLRQAAQQSCETCGIMIAFEEEYCFLESRTSENGSHFDFHLLSCYGRKLFSRRITPHSGHIQYLKARDRLEPCLYFLIDDTLLTIAPKDSRLILALTEAETDGITARELRRKLLLD